MQRVCGATLQAEAYALQSAVESGDKIRALPCELFGKITIKGDWHLALPKGHEACILLGLSFIDRSLAEWSSEEDSRQTLGHRIGIFAPRNLGRWRTDPSEVQSVRRWGCLDWYRPPIGQLPHKVDATWLFGQSTWREPHGRDCSRHLRETFNLLHMESWDLTKMGMNLVAILTGIGFRFENPKRFFTFVTQYCDTTQVDKMGVNLRCHVPLV